MKPEQTSLLAQVIPVVALALIIEGRAIARSLQWRRETGLNLPSLGTLASAFGLLTWVQAFLVKIEADMLFYDADRRPFEWPFVDDLLALVVYFALLAVFASPLIHIGWIVFEGDAVAVEFLSRTRNRYVVAFASVLVIASASSLGELAVYGDSSMTIAHSVSCVPQLCSWFPA